MYLDPPRQARGEHGRDPLAVNAVIAREVREAGQGPQGPGVPLLEWILLTNEPVECEAQARGAVDDYGCRWVIEDYHKAMKTGCGIERVQMTTRHGLDNVIATLSVLAVHLLALRDAARDERTRDDPARQYETDVKVQLAAEHAKHSDWEAMTVSQFYLAVAKMGGYVQNPAKRPPGWVILWRGYMRLEDMAEGVRLAAENCVKT